MEPNTWTRRILKNGLNPKKRNSIKPTLIVRPILIAAQTSGLVVISSAGLLYKFGMLGYWANPNHINLPTSIICFHFCGQRCGCSSGLGKFFLPPRGYLKEKVLRAVYSSYSKMQLLVLSFKPQLHDTGFITHRITFHIGLGVAVTRRWGNLVSLYSVFKEWSYSALGMRWKWIQFTSLRIPYLVDSDILV